MIQEITLKQASPMGEPDRTYGQTYWCYVQELNDPVKITTKKTMAAGTTFYGALTEKEGKKGKFYNFKSINRDDAYADTPQTHPKPVQAVLPLQRSSGTCSWGEALIAASNITNDLTMAIDVARILFNSTPEIPGEVKEPDPLDKYADSASDVIIDDIPTTGQIDLDSIPF